LDLLKNAPEAVPRWDNRPEDGPSSITGIFLYFAVVIALFDLAYTAVSATYTALFPDAFEDLEERTEVSIYRQVAAMAARRWAWLSCPSSWH
jgi:Na+/melibiose symporter-like transporter